MFRLRILDRYILREIATPFFLSIAALTLVLFLQKMFRLFELVIAKGSSFWSSAAVFGYVLPGFLVLTIPMSFLVGTLTAFMRMGSDSELTAMKASQISLYSMTRPVMIFSFGAFMVTAFTSLMIVPEANHALKLQLFDIVKSQALIGVESGVFSSTFDGKVIYVDKMKSRDKMEGLFISDERTAREPYAIVARRGRLVTDPESLSVTLAMQEGEIHAQPRNDLSYSTMMFESGNLYLHIHSAFVPKGPRTPDLEETGSLALYRKLKRAKAAGLPTAAIKSELHKRISLPFACILFGLIGAPLGIRPTRSGKSGGIGLALLVFLVYYILLASGTNLSTTGKLSPVVAYWMPNVVLTAAAAVLMYKKGHELDFGIAARLLGFFDRIWSGKKRFR